MTTRSRRFSLPLTILFATSVLLVRLPLATQAATFQIVNLDGPGEGFNDPTPAATVGGNPGTTVGEQRMNVFLEAASQWGAVLESSEIIWVAAAFDDLICTEFTAILGSSSAVAVVKDFPEEEFTDTWYPVALANARAGLDFSPGGNDIIITFNSQLNGDPTCLQGSGWYYGLDHNDFSDFDLLVVTMHEFAHGLGFAEYVDRLSGAMLLGSPDVYSQFVFDKTASQFWPAMSNPERLSSMTNDGNVLWSGSEAAAEALVLESSGVDTSLDPDLFFPRLYAPVSVAAGSSISHWDATTCFIPELGIDVACPDQLMEPFIDLPSAVVGDFTQNLADELMTDVGWPATPVAASCGNNTTEGVEACDGTDLNGTTCANFGCTGDALACQNDCTAFNTVACTDCPVCDNDFVCETGEDCINCPTDCVGGTSTTAFCGNGICEAGDGENCLNCADDCNGKQNGRPRDRFCCGDGAGQNPACGDSACSTGGLSCTLTSAPVEEYCCGASFPECTGAESCSNCAIDCTEGAEICSGGADEDCDGAIDCADSDCTGDPVCVACVPTSSKEKGLKKCTDFIDNDCDGVIDSADSDCSP